MKLHLVALHLQNVPRTVVTSSMVLVHKLGNNQKDIFVMGFTGNKEQKRKACSSPSRNMPILQQVKEMGGKLKLEIGTQKILKEFSVFTNIRLKQGSLLEN